jgi:hypothetical protein
MYEITLDRIRKQPLSQANMAMRIITWLYLTHRMLRVYELQHALAVQSGDNALAEDGIPPEEMLLECCLGLVVIERETSTVRFAHFTLQEYLDRHWRELFPSGHSAIASTCCTYLNFEHPKWRGASSFLGYAACFLGDHLREGTNDELNRQVLELLTDKAKFRLLEDGIRPLSFGENPFPLHWLLILASRHWRVYCCKAIILSICGILGNARPSHTRL